MSVQESRVGFELLDEQVCDCQEQRLEFLVTVQGFEEALRIQITFDLSYEVSHPSPQL